MLLKLSRSVIGFKYKFLSSLFCVERPTQLQRKVNCCSLLLAERLVGPTGLCCSIRCKSLPFYRRDR